MAQVEQKHLEGLTYRTSEKKKTKDENGKVTEKYVAVERELRVADLLSQADKGDSFIVATKDGRKYTIQKKPAKAE